MNCPSDMSRKSTIVFTICWFSFPDKLCFVLEQNVFIRSFDKVSFNTQVSQNGQCCLRVSKWVSRNSCLRGVVKLIFQKVEPSMEVFNNIIIVGASFIMFDKSSANNFPILCFEKLFDLLFPYWGLFGIPFLEESHFTVEKWSMGFLTSFSEGFSVLFTFRQYFSDGVEYFFNWVKPIASEVRLDIALMRLRIIITVEVEDPVSIKMGMDRHVKSVWVLADFVFWTILIVILTVALVFTRVSLLEKTEQDHKDENKFKLSFHRLIWIYINGKYQSQTYITCFILKS